MTLKRVVVIGAGMGGLAAALELAAQGLHVTVLERAAAPGGKMRQLAPGTSAMDAGPTVFTMRPVFEALFARAGERFEDHVTVEPLLILARHAWTDGSQLDLFSSVELTMEAIAAFAGRAEAERYRLFSEETRAIFMLLDRSFMQAEKPGMAGLALNMARDGLRNPLALLQLRPFETMWAALGQSFNDPRLRQLFGRYATYCGSSPFTAPATLMLIAHAEQSGVWSVKGGLHALAEAVRALAEAKGARFRFGAHVTRIRTGSSGVEGVELAGGDIVPASIVAFNGDYAALGEGLLGAGLARAVPRARRDRRSLSAIVTCREAEASGFPLIRHNVFFSDDYAAEFADLAAGRAPTQPTVYICAQDRGDEGLADEGLAAGQGLAPCAARPERLLCLINAPATGDEHDFTFKEIAQCEDRAARLMARCGLTLSEGFSETTTPTGFNALFPATGGGLYGQASQGWRASFTRPGSRTTVPGLYLCGGSVHPGPGVPMAALSGSLAANSILADLTSPRPSRRAAITGGMSTP